MRRLKYTGKVRFKGSTSFLTLEPVFLTCSRSDKEPPAQRDLLAFSFQFRGSPTQHFAWFEPPTSVVGFLAPGKPGVICSSYYWSVIYKFLLSPGVGLRVKGIQMSRKLGEIHPTSLLYLNWALCE